MNVLVTTLGKAIRQGSVDGQRGEYRTLQYDFNGRQSDATSFFGLALYRDLVARQVVIDKIVILGTAGSMWDAWLETDFALLENNVELFDRLAQGSQNDELSESDLGGLAHVLSSFYQVEIECRLISYGQTDEDQIKTVRTIEAATCGASGVYMDVTHGLRHLPMLSMMSSFLIQHAHQVQTCGIYYGAAELRTDEIAPVIQLNGLVTLERWIEAIAVLKKTGNVSPLADLPGMALFSEDLRQYQFHEQMNDVAQARAVAQRILTNLCRLPVAGQMFISILSDTFSWCKQGNYAARQYQQSKHAFEYGDYLRAVILLVESLISSLVQNAGNIMQYEEREAVRKTLDNANNPNWLLLRNLRNTLAHGSAAQGNNALVLQQMRSNRTTFVEQMNTLYAWAEDYIGEHV